MEAQYEGKLANTWVRAVQVPDESGGFFAVDVYRVVNLHTHPQLRMPAYEGRLHVLDNGRNLAVPYVVHDPPAHKWVLYVPEALCHKALKKRAAIIRLLAADSEHAIPPYVAACPVAIGHESLEAYLENQASAKHGWLVALASEVGDAAPVEENEVEELDEPGLRMARNSEVYLADDEVEVVETISGEGEDPSPI